MLNLFFFSYERGSATVTADSIPALLQWRTCEIKSASPMEWKAKNKKKKSGFKTSVYSTVIKVLNLVDVKDFILIDNK